MLLTIAPWPKACQIFVTCGQLTGNFFFGVDGILLSSKSTQHIGGHSVHQWAYLWSCWWSGISFGELKKYAVIIISHGNAAWNTTGKKKTVCIRCTTLENHENSMNCFELWNVFGTIFGQWEFPKTELIAGLSTSIDSCFDGPIAIKFWKTDFKGSDGNFIVGQCTPKLNVRPWESRLFQKMWLSSHVTWMPQAVWAIYAVPGEHCPIDYWQVGWLWACCQTINSDTNSSEGKKQWVSGEEKKARRNSSAFSLSENALEFSFFFTKPLDFLLICCMKYFSTTF